MNRLENLLKEVYKKEYAFFTGNATTALYLIFKSLNQKNKKVLFPNITCMAPVNAAIYAGYDVVFCDVNIHDFTMDINSLGKIIEQHDVGIVVPTHIYGHMCNTKEIYNLCRNKGIVVIEDAAQSLYISDYNDFAVTSFGHTKLLESGLGGGVIFYKNYDLTKNFNVYSKSLRSDSNREEFKLYTEEYYRIGKISNKNEYYKQIRNLQIKSKNIFLRHFKENDELFNILVRKDEVISERNKRICLYRKNLCSNKFIFPHIVERSDNTLWRLSILVKDLNRDEFVDKVRKSNIDISTWYPCLHRFYSEQHNNDVEHSIFIEKRIVNFWITEKYSLENIKNNIQIINKII